MLSLRSRGPYHATLHPLHCPSGGVGAGATGSAELIERARQPQVVGVREQHVLVGVESLGSGFGLCLGSGLGLG